MKFASILISVLSVTNALSIRADSDQMSGIRGAITNYKQTIDTLKAAIESHNGHAGADTVGALITGLDSQIDNLAATISNGLNGVTLGVSGKIGDFLLGPFFQSVTNGAEVVISNVVGGSYDIVSNGASKALGNALGKLVAIGSKLNVNSKDVKALENVRKQVYELKAPKKHSGASKSSKTSSSLSAPSAEATPSSAEATTSSA